jgi:hypothetical protein
VNRTTAPYVVRIAQLEREYAAALTRVRMLEREYHETRERLDTAEKLLLVWVRRASIERRQRVVGTLVKRMVTA